MEERNNATILHFNRLLITSGTVGCFNSQGFSLSLTAGDFRAPPHSDAVVTVSAGVRLEDARQPAASRLRHSESFRGRRRSDEDDDDRRPSWTAPSCGRGRRCCPSRRCRPSSAVCCYPSSAAMCREMLPARRRRGLPPHPTAVSPDAYRHLQPHRPYVH